MSTGRFFAVQERLIDAPPSVPWSYSTLARYDSAEDALEVRDSYVRATVGGTLQFRAVEVHVTTEIEVIHG